MPVDYCSAGRLLPITLVKEYYYCPLQAWHKLNLYSERPSESMRAGGLDGAKRARLLDLLGAWLEARGLSAVEMLWEHEVRSCRLGLKGYADLILVHGDSSFTLVEAKLALPPKRRRLHILVQAAAYTVAAEETLGAPSHTTLLYDAEHSRLLEISVGPSLRRLVEEAAEELHRMAGGGEPPAVRVDPHKCRGCSYRSVCPNARS